MRSSDQDRTRTDGRARRGVDRDLKQAQELLAAEVTLLEMVAQDEPLSPVLDALSRYVEAFFEGCFCSILTVSPDRRHFRHGAGPSLPDAYNQVLDGKTIDPGYGACSLAVLTGTPVITADLANDPRWEGSAWLPLMKTHGYASCWSMPILARSGEASGIFAIYRREPVAPTSDEQSLINRFTKIAGIAINRAQAEEALDRARSELAHVARVATLSALTASIAHEVNQPLSGIVTNASTCLRMLAADPPNLEGAGETARRTIRDANRAAEVVKRLRAMFAKSAPSVEMVDLNETARELIALSASELQRNRVVLQTQFAEGLPAVGGDRIQLQQVILNMLLNAADAMAGIEDRPRTLVVRTDLDDEDGVRLSVRDSGMGVDPQAVERLFDPFYTTKAQGMGIGLSISRSIIESHDGRMWAAPNDGPGATFGFCLPPAA